MGKKYGDGFSHKEPKRNANFEERVKRKRLEKKGGRGKKHFRPKR